MAKIALVLGIGILGAVTGGIAAAGLLGFSGTFAGGVVASGIVSGASIGLGVGSLLGQAIFPGHSSFNGPQINDLQVSSSANGAIRPFGYGGFRIAGQIIWSSGIKETKSTTTQSAKGGPSVTSNTYSYTVSFAAAFCEGPASVVRVWADSRLIFDTTGKGAVSSDILHTGIPADSSFSGNIGRIFGQIPGDRTLATVVPTIYTGSSTQLPNPLIQAAQGIDVTPAFRGTCYIVYEDFPLFDFGNRLPNIRAEISTGVVDSFIKDTYRNDGSGVVPFFVYMDTPNRKGYILGTDAIHIQQVDLSADSTAPLNPWVLSHVYSIGQEILDSNGNVQVVISVTGDAKSGATSPTWSNTEVVSTTDNHVTWKNLGRGPVAIKITGQGTLKPMLGSGEFLTSMAFPGHCGMAVDSSGYLWGPALVNVSHTQLNKYDPNTFLSIARLEIPAKVTAMNFCKRSDGDYLYLTSNDTTAHSNFFMAIRASDMSVSGSAPLLPLIYPAGANLQGTNYPAVGPNGQAYIVVTDTASGHYGWWIIVINAAAGFSRDEIALTGDAINGRGIGCVADATDNSLIVFTDTGCIMKLDADGNITHNTGPGKFNQESNAFGLTNMCTQYVKQNNGQVPPDRMIRVFTPRTSGATYMDTYDSATLTLQSHVIIDSWFPNNTAFGFAAVQDTSYDRATGSMLITPALFGNYTGQSYRIFINRQAIAGEALSDVVTNVLTRAGVDPSAIDVSLITGTTVLGYAITRMADARSILAPLTGAYFFDIVESDFKLRAVPRGGSAVMSIPEIDLGMASDGSKLTETIAQEHDLSKEVTIIYSDPALDYQQGKALRKRHFRVKKTINKTLITLPLTLQADVAAQIADKAVHTLWAERNSYDFKLWKSSYLKLDPSDVVSFTYNGLPFTARLTKTTMGTNLTLEINGVSEDARNYLSSVTGSIGSGFIPTTINPTAGTLVFLLDVPLLQDTDSSGTGNSGFYWGMTSPGVGWPGASLSQSSDGLSFFPIAASGDQIHFGRVSSALPAPTRSAHVWDTVNTVTVFLTNGTLSSATQTDVLNGANAALLGTEVIQFQTATLNGDGSYTLSNLLRGRRGTERGCLLHQVGETFIVLSGGGLHRNSAPTSMLGLLRYYKAVTVGQTIDSTVASQFTLAGNDLKPYSPCSVTGTRDASGNLTASWLRRTRLGGAWLSGTGTVPLSEDTELYDVDVMGFDGGGVDIVPYTVKPLIPIVQIGATPSSVGYHTRYFGEMPPGTGFLYILPFTITWEDGHTAQYKGASFGPAFNGPTSIIVYDPLRLGDANGGSVTYSTESLTPYYSSSANLPGYYFIGSISWTWGGTNSLATGSAGSEIIVRTFSNVGSLKSFSYTDADQLADFGVHPYLSPGYSRFKLYQKSAQVGRGFPAVAWL